jgi:hypothetical protein
MSAELDALLSNLDRWLESDPPEVTVHPSWLRRFAYQAGLLMSENERLRTERDACREQRTLLGIEVTRLSAQVELMRAELTNLRAVPTVPRWFRTELGRIIAGPV